MQNAGRLASGFSGFADIVRTCVEDWLLSPSWWPDHCNDDSSIKAKFTASNISTITGWRYPQSGYTRQTVGGCGVWNADADWANNTVVATARSRMRSREDAHELLILKFSVSVLSSQKRSTEN